MQNNLKVVAIIPARGGSQRLPRKNIYPIWGKPMIYWAIRAAKASQYIDDVFVSTEDKEIKEISEGFGAKVIDRPQMLAESTVYKQEVIVHAVKMLEDRPDVVISLQPNSPEVSPYNLDGAFEKFIKHDRNEIFSVDTDLIQNAVFRIMKYEYVFEKNISWRSGVWITRHIDIHTIEDVKYVEQNRHPAEIKNEKKN